MKIGITFDLKSSGAKLHDDDDEEFDSPHTIEAIAAVLRGLGHTVALLGDGREFLEKVLAEKPDFVFNFAEGRGVSRSRDRKMLFIGSYANNGGWYEVAFAIDGLSLTFEDGAFAARAIGERTFEITEGAHVRERFDFPLEGFGRFGSRLAERIG